MTGTWYIATLRFPSGRLYTCRFDSATERALFIIGLAAHGVEVVDERMETGQ